MNDVIVLKLITGEVLLAHFDNDKSTDEVICIHRPLRMITETTEDRMQRNYFLLWNSLTDEETFFIPYMHIITASPASPDVKNTFDKTIEMFYTTDNESDTKDSNTELTYYNSDDEYSYTSENGNSKYDPDTMDYILRTMVSNNAHMN